MCVGVLCGGVTLRNQLWELRRSLSEETRCYQFHAPGVHERVRTEVRVCVRVCLYLQSDTDVHSQLVEVGDEGLRKGSRAGHHLPVRRQTQQRLPSVGRDAHRQH